MNFFINLFHKFFYSDLFIRIFNRPNFTKLIIIFFIGFFSRLLINHFFHVNVFYDYFNYGSLIYYLLSISILLDIIFSLDYNIDSPYMCKHSGGFSDY